MDLDDVEDVVARDHAHNPVILENCKPILGEKLRYHRDKAFMDRLRPPPAVRTVASPWPTLK